VNFKDENKKVHFIKRHKDSKTNVFIVFYINRKKRFLCFSIAASFRFILYYKRVTSGSYLLTH